MSEEDDLAEEARRFLVEAVCALHPPGPEREQLLEWVVRLTPEELRYPGTAPEPDPDAKATRH